MWVNPSFHPSHHITSHRLPDVPTLSVRIKKKEPVLCKLDRWMMMPDDGCGMTYAIVNILDLEMEGDGGGRPSEPCEGFPCEEKLNRPGFIHTMPKDSQRDR